MKNRFGKIYNYTLGRFFECAKLYRINLNEFDQHVKSDKDDQITFFMPSKNEMSLFYKLHDKNLIKMKIIGYRMESDDYLCFAFKDKNRDKIVYTRWLCKNKFYSDAMSKHLTFSDDEAITLDSYTHPNYRYKGLHKKMNLLMLQWIKSNTEIRYVYMVIKCFLPHLTKIPLQLGYKAVERSVYYKKGSLSRNSKIIINKLLRHV